MGRTAPTAVVPAEAGTQGRAASTEAFANPALREWLFTVLLDGRPVGEHRFSVQGPPQQREVASRARMDVKFFGLFNYRYRHEANERWQGDCLRELRASTDDDGKPSEVEEKPADCIMSFAYWHPALPEQTRLLNPQTGRIEPVRVERLPASPLEVRGRIIDAVGWRLQTAKQSLNVWYARNDGSWIGLDAQVAGGRQLAYRLR